jgi:beta-lactamase class D
LKNTLHHFRLRFMKKMILLALLLLLTSCTTPKKKSNPEKHPFVGMRGCFLLYNLKTEKLEKKMGDACEERFPACSTFKVPLAVMAFDSGILKDKFQTLKWDGKKRMLEQWNRDHNAASWMKESVVWFSQELTPKLGKKKFQEYLTKFNYGNKDFSTGLTTAWLNSPSDPRGSLGITAFEQIEFMKKLWRNQLPASKSSMELTRNITYLETSPNGFKLSGKTGSNGYDAERKIQFGWFIAHVTNGEKEYIAVTNISDLKPIETKSFGGPRAKDITRQILADEGLW